MRSHAGISVVEVTFDGSGDSGPIESVEACAGDTSAELPAEPIEFVEPFMDAIASQSFQNQEQGGHHEDTAAHAGALDISI